MGLTLSCYYLNVFSFLIHISAFYAASNGFSISCVQTKAFYELELCISTSILLLTIHSENSTLTLKLQVLSNTKVNK